MKLGHQLPWPLNVLEDVLCDGTFEEASLKWELTTFYVAHSRGLVVDRLSNRAVIDVETENLDLLARTESAQISRAATEIEDPRYLLRPEGPEVTGYELRGTAL